LKSHDIRDISKRANGATKPQQQSPDNMKQHNQTTVQNETSKQSAVQKDNRSQYVTRESVLLLLSDDEVAAVATAETAARLADGDEYLDMEQLDQGVQKAHQKKTPMGRVLPKKSIHENTWQKILKQLPARPAEKVTVA
jgi:hypothetical protein